MLIMKSEIRQIMKGIELLNQECIWREGKLQVLMNIGSEQHQASGDERNNKRKPQ